MDDSLLIGLYSSMWNEIASYYAVAKTYQVEVQLATIEKCSRGLFNNRNYEVKLTCDCICWTEWSQVTTPPGEFFPVCPRSKDSWQGLVLLLRKYQLSVTGWFKTPCSINRWPIKKLFQKNDRARWCRTLCPCHKLDKTHFEDSRTLNSITLSA